MNKIYYEDNHALTALRILNNLNLFSEGLISFTYDGDFLTEIKGITAESELEFVEKLIARLKYYQDGLQQFVDLRKNIKKRTDKESSKLAHIYIMRDKRTSFHKIGRSINPKYRERTLQAEMPFVETVFVSPLTLRERENEFHRKFKEKRIRGEWFNLSVEDVKFIQEYNYGI